MLRLLYFQAYFNVVKKPELFQLGRSCHHFPAIMRNILNVAEKNDAAKNISAIMSRGASRRREGLSRFNKIYEFEYNFQGQNCNMIMTSVSGHLLSREFTAIYRSWQGCNPLVLFEAPVIKDCTQDYLPIKNTLEREIRRCDTLIIWTDCDREGENIGFEVIEVCKAVKQNIQIYRAKFSQITATAVNQAMARLVQPDQRVSDAVEVRSELDLRIGAAFTRFQTLRLQKLFPNALSQELISYGSCQFPTMGFVIERYKSIQEFVPENFWKIDVGHTQDGIDVTFRWQEDHLFDQLAVQVIFDKCEENPVATVEKVESRPKSKWRPVPLDTVELEKLASRKLRITAAETMRIAESLYSNGLISYPRTETNIFPKDLALQPLVEMQTPDPNWGEFARRVLHDGPNPRQGKKTDQAHPPIHPTKYANNLNGNQQRVYELVVRHFLACCSKDAKGQETKVKIDIASEKFHASGLMILERNYLDVYIYEKWTSTEIPVYEVGQQFEPTRLEVKDGETSPPNLLTEADLIALMEKHGIGTDATHAEHIETTKKRKYVGLHDNQYFVPCQLGMGLAEGYDNMGFNMSKPYLRAELESDLKKICIGAKNPQDVLREQIARYREVFVRTIEQAGKIDTAVEQYLQEQRQAANVALPANPVLQRVRPCPNCGQDMMLKQKRDQSFFVTCSGFPACRTAQWFPAAVKQAEVTDEACHQCGPRTKRIKFKFQRGEFDIFYPELQHTACIAGCDQDFLTNIGISAANNNNRGGGGQAPSTLSDSGYESLGTPSQTNHQRDAMTRGGGAAATGRGAWGRGAVVDVAPRGGRGVDHGRGGVVRNAGPWGGGGGTGFGGRGGAPANNMDRRQNAALPPPAAESQEDDGVIYCQCSEPAALRTVRKETSNKGRQFYSCSKGPGNQSCSFFQWAEEVAGDTPAQTQTWGGGGDNHANIPRGRGGGGHGGNHFNNPRGAFRGRGGGARAAGEARRKCGVCGEQGHTRRTCPMNNPN